MKFFKFSNLLYYYHHCEDRIEFILDKRNLLRNFLVKKKKIKSYFGCGKKFRWSRSVSFFLLLNFNLFDHQYHHHHHHPNIIDHHYGYRLWNKFQIVFFFVFVSSAMISIIIIIIIERLSGVIVMEPLLSWLWIVERFSSTN